MAGTPGSGAPAAGTLGHGMEMALTVLVFLGFGFALDRWLGTKPAFMIALVVFAMVGQFVKIWLSYERTMKALDAERVARRSSNARTLGGEARQ
jgi:F0F1-type ATP synthase assembly protein I